MIAPILHAAARLATAQVRSPRCSLLTYDQAHRSGGIDRRGHRRLTETPPWHADQRYGQFANDRQPERAREHDRLLTAWIQQGTLARRLARALGVARNSPRAGRSAHRTSCTRCPKTFVVQATGNSPHQTFPADDNSHRRPLYPGRRGLRPGDRSVVHHVCDLFADDHTKEEADRPRQRETCWSLIPPDDMPSVYLAPGIAKKIAPGTDPGASRCTTHRSARYDLTERRSV